MPRFDAELYLRLQGEELLIGAGEQRHDPWGMPLAEPAGALVAIGAISAAKARTAIAGYSLATALRSEHGLHHRSFQSSAGVRARNVKPLEPRRVVPCDRAIESPQGTMHIRRVSLSEDFTTIAITWRPSTAGGRSRRRGGFTMIGRGTGGPPSPTLGDDRGTQAGATFNGGGSDEEWEGHLTSDQPLSRETAWIEIDGARVELAGEPWPSEVSIVTLPEQPVAQAYLWRRLATRGHFHQGLETLEPAIDAFVAAGAVAAEDPVLDEIRGVLEAMPQHPGMPSGAPAGRRVPEPWRSLLARQQRHDGPEGTLTLAAVTPVFDGFSVAVSCIESRPEGFGIEIDVAPGLEARRPYARSLEPGRLAWWAADDRGNNYLGQIENWSGYDDRSSGEVGFWPALHPKARRLQIMPTAETTRAVISLQLPWAGEGPAGSRKPT